MFDHRRGRAAASAAVALALLTAGCGGGSAADGGSADDPITLTMGLYGTFGYEEAGLYEEYMELHPEIRIEQSVVAQSGAYYQALQTRLAAGSGMADVQGIEIGFVADVTANHADAFVDFAAQDNADELEGTFYDWKWDQASTTDGRVIGLGTDAGPQAMCYRQDLFEAAGLPTDPAAVSALWPTWDDYLATGQQYTDSATRQEGSSFVDSPNSVFAPAVRQGDVAYDDEDGNPVVEDSDGVETAWDLASQAADDGLTASLAQFGDDWNAAFSNGAFATIACPSWMLGYITSQMGDEGAGLWNVATLPGQAEAGSTWGGSWLGVPSSGEHVEEATALVEWLTAPEQQVRMFTDGGFFPSSSTAAESPEVADTVSEYFSDAPIGQVFGDAADSVRRTPIGPYDTQIQDAFSAALTTVADGDRTPDEAYTDALNAIEQVVGG
ncbi:ABC transporter substrate-binding protein [Geodermatophilus sp. Leaf369]|uniref:extracellular solute-binding protein n=1 Tax=Geodermatophilus sp. Leaf369 TaxID=1736354 RepID=UPI0006F6902F|nr:extracellular solute-binding protein [Geodermatophilus sp. Leaf369]KQS60608.1 ABC transporter substrate-binding protein [Geodermatophilus sp. Leaf369]